MYIGLILFLLLHNLSFSTGDNDQMLNPQTFHFLLTTVYLPVLSTLVRFSSIYQSQNLMKGCSRFSQTQRIDCIILLLGRRTMLWCGVDEPVEVWDYLALFYSKFNVFINKMGEKELCFELWEALKTFYERKYTIYQGFIQS